MAAFSQSPKGWHSRGYLPHCDFPGLIQGVTFRLDDAVPHSVIASWKRGLDWIDKRSDGEDAKFDEQRKELHRRLAEYEDAGYGACHLRNPDIAVILEEALLYFHGERYLLLAWRVMPNHVHTLVRLHSGWSIGGVVQSWKRYTARAANTSLGVRGSFWARDYYDRYIRDEAHFGRAVTYIQQNPVKAKLCTTPEEWPWSSACRQKKEREFPNSLQCKDPEEKRNTG